LVGACAGGLAAVGMVLFMHHIQLGAFVFGFKGVALGLLGILSVMFFWWKDVLFEAVTEKAHTPKARTGLRMGMALFICSEVMFFFAFFWAFFSSAFNPAEAIGYVWPPKGLSVINPFELPLLMTMLLLLSGCTVTWAHHAILAGHKEESVRALRCTIALGIAFLCFQIFEYAHAKFHFTGGIYPSTFFMATGFHGFHVFVGTAFLIVCYFRAKKGHFSPDSHFGFEAAAWYWHFVDVVWLFLFISIYFWGNTIGTDQAALHAIKAEVQPAAATAPATAGAAPADGGSAAAAPASAGGK
jgi:cytochrome c oxidase subunit 3